MDAPSETALRLTVAQMSGHLVEDWLPGVRFVSQRPVFEWATALLHPTSVDQTYYWTAARRLYTTERQWKISVSWVFGVVGARHLLADEGYRWIAPVSAFYNADPVDEGVTLGRWPGIFPPSALVAARKPNSGNTRRPDYLAIRRRGAPYGREFATAEAKGSNESRATCPPSAKAQAENIELTHHRLHRPVSRHLVSVTTVNPQPTDAVLRRLELRGWNSARVVTDPVPEAAVEVAAAHLFGLCVNLGLRRNARALALGVAARAGGDGSPSRGASKNVMRRVANAADEELRRWPGGDLLGQRQGTPRYTTVVGSFGRLGVNIVPTTVSLVQELRSADAAEALRFLDLADSELDRLVATQPDDPRSALLPSGVAVRLER